MPPDTRTELLLVSSEKPRRTTTRTKTNTAMFCLDAFTFQACKPRVMRARPGEYLGSFVFLDLYFLLEAFTIDPPPDQKRMKKKKEKIVAEKKMLSGSSTDTGPIDEEKTWPRDHCT